MGVPGSVVVGEEVGGSPERLNSGFGLGRNLVCTIQVKRIQRIRSPDIMGSTVEQLGGYRIAWNRAWLEENKDQQLQ